MQCVQSPDTCFSMLMTLQSSGDLISLEAIPKRKLQLPATASIGNPPECRGCRCRIGVPHNDVIHHVEHFEPEGNRLALVNFPGFVHSGIPGKATGPGNCIITKIAKPLFR